MKEILLNDVMGIFRKCRVCGVYKSLGNFWSTHKSVGHVCSARYKGQLIGGSPGKGTRTRMLTITDAGRAALREWERDHPEEAA